MKTITFLCFLSFALPLLASEWTGGNANWSSDASPGWNGTGVPNAQGAVAEFPLTVNASVTQDAEGVRIGVLTMSGNKQLSFSKASGVSTILVFDADGAGPGHAAITNAGNSRISFGSGNLTLADDLEIVNAQPAPYNITYAIGGNGSLTGTGNVIFDNNQMATNLCIYMGTSGNFTGDVLIRRGSVKYNSNGNTSSFGAQNTSKNTGNHVTLGSPNGGAAVLWMEGSGAIFAHSLETASGADGELRIESLFRSGNWTATIAGPVTLYDNLVLAMQSPNEGNTSELRCRSVISGAGGLVVDGPGLVTLSAANTYAGGTTVRAGTLSVTDSGTLGTGSVSVEAGATLSLATSSALSGNAALTLGESDDAFGYVQLTANATAKTLDIGMRKMAKGTYGATGSGAKYIRDDLFSGTGILTVLEGPPEGIVVLIR